MAIPKKKTKDAGLVAKIPDSTPKVDLAQVPAGTVITKELLQEASKILNSAPVPEDDRRIGGIVLPYALRKELEAIQKNTGMDIDYSLPVEELEKICNKANNPAASWRDRWNG